MVIANARRFRRDRHTKRLPNRRHSDRKKETGYGEMQMWISRITSGKLSPREISSEKKEFSLSLCQRVEDDARFFIDNIAR